MICPYRKELIIEENGGYKESWATCEERECPYFDLSLVKGCWKALEEITHIKQEGKIKLE